MQKHVWLCLVNISGLKSISNFKSYMTKYLMKCHPNLIKWLHKIYFLFICFRLLSGYASQQVLIVKLTIYKQIFFKLVDPSTKILLIMILHYCYFKTGDPDRATTIYRYLIKRLWKVWFPYSYLSFCNCCAKQCILLTFIC